MYKVILVDDEYNIREGLITIINWEEQGFEIAALACDGIEALELSEKISPNLVITDIKMPRMNGIELAKELQQRNADIKVVILSGYNDFSYAKEAMKYGVSNYLLKPVEKDELCSELAVIKERIDSCLHTKRKESLLMNIVRKGLGEKNFDKNALDFNLDINDEILEPEQMNKANKDIRKILEYINQHYDEDLNLKKLANMFYLNPIYLGQLFKKVTGELFHDYINKVRIENAKILLENNLMSINEISEKVGYKSIDHFYRNFKNVAGCSPGSYKKTQN